MLVGLRIQNIALIESLELSFENGFTVLTGETGAGKSLLIDALEALFEGSFSETSSKLLRKRAPKAYIEAQFSMNSSVRSWLADQSFECDDSELFITREWRYNDDRLTSRCRLNGAIVNRQQISSLKPLLIDFTVQGQTQDLSSKYKQLYWLDRLGGLPIQKIQKKGTLDNVF